MENALRAGVLGGACAYAGPTGVSRAVRSTRPPPVVWQWGRTHETRRPERLRLRGLIHLPITFSTPAAGGQMSHALESCRAARPPTSPSGAGAGIPTRSSQVSFSFLRNNLLPVS